MKVLKITSSKQNMASAVSGYKVIYNDGVQRNDVQLIMSILGRYNSTHFTLDISMLDVAILK